MVEAQLAHTLDIEHHLLRRIIDVYHLVEYLLAVALDDEDGIVLVAVLIGVAKGTQYKAHLVVALWQVEDDESRLVGGNESGTSRAHDETI